MPPLVRPPRDSLWPYPFFSTLILLNSPCFVSYLPLVLDPALQLPSPLLCHRTLPHDYHEPERPPSDSPLSLLTLGPRPVTPVPMPPDTAPDSSLTEAAILRRATEHYPLRSAVVLPDPVTARLPTVREAFTQAAQRKFKHVLDELDPRIRAKLEQPFGKDNLTQCFRSEASLRHILLPLWKSGFLAGDTASWDNFSDAYYPVRVLSDLLDDYGDVDFTSLPGFPQQWESETEVNMDRLAQVSAALLHFNGSVADLVRWIGGPHVGAHRDHPTILSRLEEAGLPQSLLDTLSRIFYQGIPNHCNADSTERNFAAFYNYGNHSTVDADPAKAYKAMLKDNKRGFTLLFDKRLLLFLLHAHSTPQGMVDLLSLFKNPRPIFDSSFRPEVWCIAINDWTTKLTEPELTFATAELLFMIWLYNLRVTYPFLDIFLGDDDVSGAFRWLKYHPNLVALHASIMCGLGVLNTGGTFGDNTTPSNFDPIALARRLLAQHLWSINSPHIAAALAHLPPLHFSPSPTVEEAKSFSQADRDSLNPGVLFPDGSRKPPPYNMHVDDNLYADIGPFMLRTIGASVAALFTVLGPPTNPDVPSALSFDKFEGSYNHQRKMVGRLFDSRKLTVGMLPHKREELIQTLEAWTTYTSYDLPEISSLLGLLDNHTKYASWARSWYFSLYNSVRAALSQRYAILRRRNRQFAAQETSLRRSLPPGLAKRIPGLIARGKARLIWATRQRFQLTALDKGALSILLAYLRDHTSPWDVPLGMVVPRQPSIVSQGDASFLGGGAHCPTLEFWFDVIWSPSVTAGLRYRKSSHPGFVHINCLEYLVVLLQHAAIIVRLAQATPSQVSRWFPAGRPTLPYWMGDCDNEVSTHWDRAMSARGVPGQNLIGVASELKRQFALRAETQHLAGEENVVADDISRNDFSLPFPSRSSQLFAKHPSLATWDFFLPSPELLQLLYSKLFSGPARAPCVLPTVLGQFVPAGSTTLSSPVI